MRFSKSRDEYEQVAPVYDSIVGPFVKPIRRQICRIAEAHRFKNILDICCGTGQQATMLARAGFRVTGVDLSAAMLEVAKSGTPRSAQYYLEDAANLHFEDNTFDCAIISFALHEKDPLIRRGIMKEARRVLTDEGRVLIVDYMEPDNHISTIGNKLMSLVEWLAGVEHYVNYKYYMQHGATNTLLTEHDLVALQIIRYHLEATGLIVAKWRGT